MALTNIKPSLVPSVNAPSAGVIWTNVVAWKYGKPYKESTLRKYRVKVNAVSVIQIKVPSLSGGRDMWLLQTVGKESPGERKAAAIELRKRARES